MMLLGLPLPNFAHLGDLIAKFVYQNIIVMNFPRYLPPCPFERIWTQTIISTAVATLLKILKAYLCLCQLLLCHWHTPRCPTPIIYCIYPAGRPTFSPDVVNSQNSASDLETSARNSELRRRG